METTPGHGRQAAVAILRSLSGAGQRSYAGLASLADIVHRSRSWHHREWTDLPEPRIRSRILPPNSHTGFPCPGVPIRRDAGESAHVLVETHCAVETERGGAAVAVTNSARDREVLVLLQPHGERKGRADRKAPSQAVVPSGVALRTLRTRGACRTHRACGTLRTRGTRRACGTLRTRGACGTRRACGTLRTRGACRTRRACGTLRTRGACRTRRARGPLTVVEIKVHVVVATTGRDRGARSDGGTMGDSSARNRLRRPRSAASRSPIQNVVRASWSDQVRCPENKGRDRQDCRITGSAETPLTQRSHENPLFALNPATLAVMNHSIRQRKMLPIGLMTLSTEIHTVCLFCNDVPRPTMQPRDRRRVVQPTERWSGVGSQAPGLDAWPENKASTEPGIAKRCLELRLMFHLESRHSVSSPDAVRWRSSQAQISPTSNTMRAPVKRLGPSPTCAKP